MERTTPFLGFPTWLSLINPLTGAAFALRYDKTIEISARAEIMADESPADQKILSYWTHCGICDAIALSNFRITATGPDLRPLEGSVRVTVDGDPVVRGLIEDVADGRGRKPKTFSSAHIYVAGRLTEDNQADGTDPIGIFVPNLTEIIVRVEDLCVLPAAKIVFEASFDAAVYTTRAGKGFTAGKGTGRAVR